MTSLPMPSCLSQPVLISPACSPGLASKENEQFLLQAFSSFSEAAGSLERSYGLLRAEVARLGLELEASNVGLARSLAENTHMREHLGITHWKMNWVAPLAPSFLPKDAPGCNHPSPGELLRD